MIIYVRKFKFVKFPNASSCVTSNLLFNSGGIRWWNNSSLNLCYFLPEGTYFRLHVFIHLLVSWFAAIPFAPAVAQKASERLWWKWMYGLPIYSHRFWERSTMDQAKAISYYIFFSWTFSLTLIQFICIFEWYPLTI